MRILQINTVTNGSTGKIARDIAKILKDTGNDCMIAFGRGRAPDDGLTYYKFTDKLSVYYHALVSRITDKVGFYSIRNSRKLVKKIKEYNPDVIHLHNLHGYYINIEILFEFLAEYDKPVIWTLHDCWAFTGHCCYFDMAGCDKWRSGCHNCTNKKQYPKSICRDRSRKNYEKKKKILSGIKKLTIVSVSKWLDGLVGQSFLKDKKHIVIYNGIDLNTFKFTNNNFRDKYDLKDTTMVLGVASVWDERKGLKDYIRLAELLGDEYKVVLVGLSKKQIWQLSNNIIGIERTDSVEELVNIYSAADVFVNLTYEENYPTVNLEAAACGIYIITYNTGGSIEAAGRNGVSVNKGDLSSVIEIIKKKQYSVSVDYNHLDRECQFFKYIELYNNIREIVKIDNSLN